MASQERKEMGISVCDELGIVGFFGATIWFATSSDGKRFCGTASAFWSAIVFALFPQKVPIVGALLTKGRPRPWSTERVRGVPKLVLQGTLQFLS